MASCFFFAKKAQKALSQSGSNAQLGPKMSKMVHNGEEKCHFYASTESLMTETQQKRTVAVISTEK